MTQPISTQIFQGAPPLALSNMADASYGFPGLQPGFGPPTMYLDFDGVLNRDHDIFVYDRCHDDDLFNPCAHLNRECVELVHSVVVATGCEVVISSTWRREYDLRSLRGFLYGMGFVRTDAIVRATPHISGMHRYNEICADIAGKGPSRPRKICIVDDVETAAHPEGKHVLVLTDSRTGFTVDDAARAIRLLTLCARPGR